MISKGGIAVIDALSTGWEATPVDLAAETVYSQAHIYDMLDDLSDAGLLIGHRGPNNQRKVRIANHPVVESYRALKSELSHVEWANLLSPAALKMCWFLGDPRQVSEIAERLGITRQGFHKALSPFKNRAMLSPFGPEYALSEDLALLLAFAQAVVTHEHRSRAREIAPSVTIEWCDPKRALVRVQTTEDTDALLNAPDWQVTELGRFEEYGLQFFLAGEPAFWYAPDEELTLGEVVCHTLILDSGSRRVSYLMLLIEALDIDQGTLTDTARWYDLEPTVAVMYQALQDGVEDSDEVPVAPPNESEFMSLKEQYSIV